MFVGSWTQKFGEKHDSRMAWERKAVPCGVQETEKKQEGHGALPQ